VTSDVANEINLRWLESRDAPGPGGDDGEYGEHGEREHGAIDRHEIVDAVTVICTAAGLLHARWDELTEAQRRELAATVEAFNDMAATLAAVEHHAVALAEDPDSPVHADPLPGRTGQAMQAALDRLRSSISAAEQHRAELTELATRDGLTGLLNRTAAMDLVERELARARRDGSTLLALYVDLDGLKALNDTQGHAAGDEAIRRTADALAATTRDADVVARLGGDEFLVVGPVPPNGHSGVAAFADRVHRAVSDRVIELEDGSTVRLGCSVGVAVSCPDVASADSLVRAADVALYRAKEAGRGRVVWSTPPECADAG